MNIEFFQKFYKNHLKDTTTSTTFSTTYSTGTTTTTGEPEYLFTDKMPDQSTTKPGLPTTKPTETINLITIDKEEDSKMPEKTDEDENDAR